MTTKAKQAADLKERPLFRRVAPTFWTGETGKALRKRGPEALAVAMFLMTSPNANMLGLYVQPLAFIAYYVALPVEGVAKALKDCADVGFAEFDADSEVIWILAMAKWQIGTQLSSGDKLCKHVQKAYDALPKNPFLGVFFDRYAAAYHLQNRRDFEPDPGQPDMFHGKGLGIAGAGPGAGPGEGPPPYPPPSGGGSGAGAEGGRTAATVVLIANPPGILESPTAQAILRGLKAAGIMPNAGHLDFRALLEAGATWPEFEVHVAKALKTARPFQYLIAAVIGERERAAARGPLPPAPSPGVPAESTIAREKREFYTAMSGGLGAARAPSAFPQPDAAGQAAVIDMESPDAPRRLA